MFNGTTLLCEVVESRVIPSHDARIIIRGCNTTHGAMVALNGVRCCVVNIEGERFHLQPQVDIHMTNLVSVRQGMMVNFEAAATSAPSNIKPLAVSKPVKLHLHSPHIVDESAPENFKHGIISIPIDCIVELVHGDLQNGLGGMYTDFIEVRHYGRVGKISRNVVEPVIEPDFSLPATSVPKLQGSIGQSPLSSSSINTASSYAAPTQTQIAEQLSKVMLNPPGKSTSTAPQPQADKKPTVQVPQRPGVNSQTPVSNTFTVPPAIGIDTSVPPAIGSDAYAQQANEGRKTPTRPGPQRKAAGLPNVLTDDFHSSATFQGPRPGYVFTSKNEIPGYYRDTYVPPEDYSVGPITNQGSYGAMPQPSVDVTPPQGYSIPTQQSYSIPTQQGYSMSTQQNYTMPTQQAYEPPSQPAYQQQTYGTTTQSNAAPASTALGSSGSAQAAQSSNAPPGVTRAGPPGIGNRRF